MLFKTRICFFWKCPLEACINHSSKTSSFIASLTISHDHVRHQNLEMGHFNARSTRQSHAPLNAWLHVGFLLKRTCKGSTLGHISFRYFFTRRRQGPKGGPYFGWKIILQLGWMKLNRVSATHPLQDVEHPVGCMTTPWVLTPHD